MISGRWRRTWRNLAQPSALAMLFFGFGSGLPILLVITTMGLWLKDAGFDVGTITLLTGVSMAYALKFLWAPLVDRTTLPLIGRLGWRRSWLLLAQVCVIIGLLGMALATPQRLGWFVASALFTAFFSATQDTVLAAYRIEIAPAEAQAALAAAVILGYRVALIISGGLALVLADHMAWPWVYVVMAAFMLIAVATTLLAREPDVAHDPGKNWRQRMIEGVVEPFADFFRRFKWALGIGLLAFLLLFKISDQALAGGLMGPFYVAAGFSNTVIGTVHGVYGVWISIAGAFLGGVVVARYGLRPSLWAAMILGAISNLVYVGLAHQHGNVMAFYLAITGENLSGGFLGTVAVAYLSALVSRRYTATQYALFDSLINLPAKFLGMASGSLVVWLSAAPTASMQGYSYYFLFTTVAIVPALLLFAWLGPRVRLDGGAAK